MNSRAADLALRFVRYAGLWTLVGVFFFTQDVAWAPPLRSSLRSSRHAPATYSGSPGTCRICVPAYLRRLRLASMWNDARFESYEVNQSIAVGGDYLGTRWRRSQDKIGLVVLSSGIAHNVQSYLRFGGDGILLGDGSLRYGRESIIESYYNAHLAPGVFAAVDVQHIQNPGYNRERGPVWVFGLRLHLEL